MNEELLKRLDTIAEKLGVATNHHFYDLYIEIDECGHPFICTLEQKESREKKYNSPLQQAIRSRGGYL